MPIINLLLCLGLVIKFVVRVRVRVRASVWVRVRVRARVKVRARVRARLGLGLWLGFGLGLVRACCIFANSSSPRSRFVYCVALGLLGSGLGWCTASR